MTEEELRDSFISLYDMIVLLLTYTRNIMIIYMIKQLTEIEG